MMAEAPYSTIKIKGHEDWLAKRTQGIGGSDAAAVAGISPFKSPVKLWLEKTGAIEPDDISEQKNVKWGTLLEPVLADEYARTHPTVKVRRQNAILRSKLVDFPMQASLDRVVTCPDRGRGGLEIKTTGWFPGMHWGEDGAEDGVPDFYQVQVQHYLGVTGFDFFDVAVLIGGQDDRYYTIQRDQDVIDALIDVEARFWAMVEAGVMPELTGHSDEGGILRDRFKNVNDEVLDLSENQEAVRWADQYIIGRQAAADGKALKEQAASNLKALLGEHCKGKVGGVKLSWSRFDKSSTDLKALREAHPAIVAEFTTDKPNDRLTVTAPKPSK